MDSTQEIANMWELCVFSYNVAEAPGNPSFCPFPVLFIQLPLSCFLLFLMKGFYTESKYGFARKYRAIHFGFFYK